MAIDKSKFDRLTPEERIIKLKELEKKLQEKHIKDVNEIETLINRSVQQIRTDKLADRIAPEQREVEISDLFERENERSEGNMGQNLSVGRNYNILTQISQDYVELKTMDGIVSQGYNLTTDQRNLVGQIGERLNVAEKYMTDSEKAVNILNPSRAILYKLRKETGID